MSIYHKFLQHDFGMGFQTHYSILDITPYEPEVMFLGTFNPDTQNDNFADFFYGRNFFWPALKNLFIYNEIILGNRRMSTRGIPSSNLNPTVEEILQICKKLKLTFSDLIYQVLNDDIYYDILNNDNIIYNQNEYNLIQDNKRGNICGLLELNNQNLVNWNTINIINYLIHNPKIKTIYFTRQPTGVWGEEWNTIITNPNLLDRNFTNIYTPSGNGLKGSPRMNSLMNHWIHNNDPNFGKLDNDWLIYNNVDLNNFIF
jgi:hypothetical protein